MLKLRQVEKTSLINHGRDILQMQKNELKCSLTLHFLKQYRKVDLPKRFTRDELVRDPELLRLSKEFNQQVKLGNYNQSDFPQFLAKKR